MVDRLCGAAATSVCSFLRLLSVICLLMALSALTPVFADADLRLPRVVISSGGPYQARDTQIQTFRSVIEVPPEYAMQPMSLVATDGDEKSPGYNWVRMFLLPDSSDADLQNLSQPVGRLLVDATSFASSAQIYVDLTQQLKAGRNNIYVEGAGPAGSVFTWELRSIGPPRLFEPDTIATTAGDWLTIYGAGFSMRPQENLVQVGNFPVSVGQSEYGWVRIGIPKNFPPGTYDLSVSIREYRSRVIKLEVMKPANPDS